MPMLNPIKKWCTRNINGHVNPIKKWWNTNINRHVNPIKKNDAIER